MKLVYGVGINDLVEETRGSPFYRRWKSVLARCYSEDVHNSHPTYEDKEVCEDWILLSNFKEWMSNQKWEGLDLDKDILVENNTLYSPATCAFVPKEINSLLSLKPKRNKFPYGVTQSGKKYRARIFYDKKDVCLGTYHTIEQAHKVWQWERANQLEKIISWYSSQDSFRTDVAEALTQRVWKLRLNAMNNEETKSI